MSNALLQCTKIPRSRKSRTRSIGMFFNSWDAQLDDIVSFESPPSCSTMYITQRILTTSGVLPRAVSEPGHRVTSRRQRKIKTRRSASWRELNLCLGSWGEIQYNFHSITPTVQGIQQADPKPNVYLTSNGPHMLPS